MLLSLSFHQNYFNHLIRVRFNRFSEALSTQCFHWVLTRIQHHIDMIGSDKKNARLWAKRLHIGILVRPAKLAYTNVSRI